MTSLTTEEANRLFAVVEKYSRRLAHWLRNKPGAVSEVQEFEHSKLILPEGCGTNIPPIGIVAQGIVEVQGLMPSLCAKKGCETISYPLALRCVGEVVGEIEFLTHRNLEGVWMRRWSAYAGMQTFYFTPFQNTKEGPYFDVKKRLIKNSRNSITKIAWLKTEMLDLDGIDALNEIAIKRLLPLTSLWLPRVEDIKRERSSSTLLAANLFLEVLKAVQGHKMVFRSFSFDDMAKVSSWDPKILGSVHGKDYGRYEECIVLGAFQACSQDEAIILLPHYLTASLVVPNSTPIVPGMPNQMNEALKLVVSIAGDYLRQHKTLVPGNPHAEREVVAIYTNRHQKKFVHSSRGEEDDNFVKKLGRALRINHLRSLDDLKKLGMLGSAALIILPKGRLEDVLA